VVGTGKEKLGKKCAGFSHQCRGGGGADPREGLIYHRNEGQHPLTKRGKGEEGGACKWLPWDVWSIEGLERKFKTPKNGPLLSRKWEKTGFP